MTRLLLAAITALLVTAGAIAETPLLEPQDLGVLLYRKEDSFLPLELQSAVRQERSPFLSTVSEEYLVVPGSRSSVRFRSGDGIAFYLRVFLNDSDPRAAFFPLRDPTRFKLVEMQSTKDERRMTLVKSGFTYTNRQVGRPLLVRLYGEQCFQLTPSEPLPPGEYAIKYLLEDEYSDEEAYELFCFGIDP